MRDRKREHLVNQATLLYNEVYRFAYSRVKEKDVAQDIAQNVMETVMLKIDMIKEESNLKCWVMAIISNKIRDYFRDLKKKQEKCVMDLEDKEFMKEVCAIEEDILHILEQKESGENVIKALLALDEKYSQVIKQHIFYGNNFYQVAEKLGLNYNTAKTRYKRGIELLRKKYVEIEDGVEQNDR